jgi:hypothetical protein
MGEEGGVVGSVCLRVRPMISRNNEDLLRPIMSDS